MGFVFGQKLIDLLRGKRYGSYIPKTDYHRLFKKIYYPYYRLNDVILEGSSNLYNEFGEKLEEFFVRDNLSVHYPYRNSRYFYFDRYNYGLKTHFYGNKGIFEVFANPERKYAFLSESEVMIPGLYNKVLKQEKYMENFDLIFTYSDRILDKYENARFVPFASALWNKEIKDDLYQNKTKNISMLASKKIKCEIHKFRYDLAFKCKNNHLADTFGTFDGGRRVEPIDDTLNDYRYTICLENDIKPYYFSERFTSALAAQTIPIYLGATEIDKFFNPDGIIKITTKDDIEKVLKQCTKEEYERRQPAVLDNYKRVMEYKNPWDYMYLKYLR